MGVLETPSVRGTFVLNTFDFIREHYSPAAHTMVLQMLPVPRPSLSEARETSWTPLEDLVAYMETAKTVLAPGDPTFYRKMGFYGGSHMRALWVGIAVSEPTRALRFCAFTICRRPRPSASAFSAPWRASSVCRQYQCESRSEPAPAMETGTARYSSRVNQRGRRMREPRPPSQKRLLCSYRSRLSSTSDRDARRGPSPIPSAPFEARWTSQPRQAKYSADASRLSSTSSMMRTRQLNSGRDGRRSCVLIGKNVSPPPVQVGDTATHW